jgi:excisionase family DNA binding protein
MAGKLFDCEMTSAYANGMNKNSSVFVHREETQMELLKTKAAAKYLAMSATTLRELAHQGKIAYVSVGENTSDLRFRVSDLDAFVERYRIPAVSEVTSRV